MGRISRSLGGVKGSRRESFVSLEKSKELKHAHKQRVQTLTPAHELKLAHKPQTPRTCAFALLEQDDRLHLVTSAKTPQQELRHKSAKHIHTEA